MLFRRQGPASPTVFNYNPWTFLWSIERYFPLPDCTDSPGIDYVSDPTAFVQHGILTFDRATRRSATRRARPSRTLKGTNGMHRDV
jgi:hypothetical protein